MHHQTKTKRGFTLIEVLLAATIAVIAMGAMMQVFLASLEMYGVSIGNLYQNADLRRFCENVTRDTTRAQTITLNGNDEVLLTMRDGSTVRYTRAGGSSFGAITRVDSATGITSVVADRVRPPLSGTVFSTRQNDAALYIKGRVSCRARSLRSPELNSDFEFLVTRRG
jgi:prepilin-type N-terminal cleavage/methylation domain-containing protein